jgi:hypothetical protein
MCANSGWQRRLFCEAGFKETKADFHKKESMI